MYDKVYNIWQHRDIKLKRIIQKQYQGEVPKVWPKETGEKHIPNKNTIKIKN